MKRGAGALSHTGVIKSNSLVLCEEESKIRLIIYFSCSVFLRNNQEERRVVYVGRLRSDCTRTELKRRFEVFGEIEECAVNLRDDGDNFGFIMYRYPCDAFAALENGHTLRRSNEPQFELCFGGQKQFCKSHYTDLDSHSDDFDPASTKSKYDSMDFDSLLREAQRSLSR
ncbi:peroxisome proliferator-activated receptor gamma coactivator 1-alpha-like [Thalassophryne amazonica]|uniref:peroxisome proliferator-activated receptor gamma coactivator 1-alpha-like n=1 Tax=Thalassophryne amazonica TaxID=390379 RepID=UPI0014714189|nr:peroxisome proliferator-activated receptor gamma coactivator 1-alpha-like [Thalassophryne amazonica]